MYALLYTLFVYMVRVSRRAMAWWILVSHSQRVSEHQNLPLYRAAPHVSSIIFRTKYTCSLRVHPPLFDGCHYTRTIERCNQIVYRSGVVFSAWNAGRSRGPRRAGAVCLAGRWASHFRGAIIHQLVPVRLAVVYRSGQLLPPAG